MKHSASPWALIRALRDLDLVDQALHLVGGEAEGLRDEDLAPAAFRGLETLRGMDPELDEALDNHGGWSK